MTNPVRTRTAPAAAFDLKAAVSLLETILRAQNEGYTSMLVCLERKRQAIRTADIERVSAICGEENILVQKLGELEKRRIELSGRMTQHFAPTATAPMTVSQLASRLGSPAGDRVLAHAAILKESMQKARRESSIVKAAADALSRHMSGIVQTVHSALSRARVYGQKGRIVLGAQLESCVDIKS